MTLNATSAFFSLTEYFDVTLLETLTPHAVEKLKVMNDLTTHNSAFITFALPKELESVSNEMLFDVRLKLTGEAEKWKKIEHPRIQLKNGEVFLALDNLSYANTDYQLKIRFKSKVAEDSAEMWSPFRDVPFKTKPKWPEMLPKTCANCFNVMDNGNVVVYWMGVPKLFQNADGFKYHVSGSNEHGDEILYEDLNETSMVLTNDVDAQNLTMRLFSMNNEGISEAFSQIDVPILKLQSNKRLLNIRKELINREYKISWSPVEELDIESFIVFWCHQRNELSNQCDDDINFKYVPMNVTEFVMEATMMIQFGVAVNLMDASMVHGFEWAECTASKANGEPQEFLEYHDLIEIF